MTKRSSVLCLFSDASADPTTKWGVGAYLLIDQNDIALLSQPKNEKILIERLRFHNETQTSSTKLEIQTLLVALGDYHKEAENSALQIYTDSQAIMGLLKRRVSLTQKNFVSKRSGTELTLADLYRQYYAFYDAHPFFVIKLKGHSNSSDVVSPEQQIFSILDQQVRKKLREKRAVT